MKLQLTRPIAFFDIESTDKDPKKARIIELGIVKLYPDGKRLDVKYLCNPGVNITDENAAIHGFTNEMVKDWPLFKSVAENVADQLEGCDLGGYNSNKYDIPLLAEEFNRAGYPFSFAGMEFIDVLNIFHHVDPRTLTAAVLKYLNKDHEGAHGAIADTIATIDVLEAIIDRHPDKVPLTAPELGLLSNNGNKRLDISGLFAYRKDGVVIFTKGKNANDPVFKEKSYLKWMRDAKDSKTGDFIYSADTRAVANDLFFDLLPNISGELVAPSKPTGYSHGYKHVR